MPEALHFQLDEYYLDLQKQGQDMEILDQDDTRRNPFPGLRPFRTAEAHLFFGREGQAEALIARLMQTRFLGVLGNSGSGKSSLVRAGLIPALHAGKKQERIADWKIAVCRPGNSPVQNLAAALAGANKNSTAPKVLVPEIKRLLPLLRDSSFGLLEAEAGAAPDGKTLLVVDQFEELFRFERDIPPGEAAHFVDLLLNAVQQEEGRLYVVVTMRSEFLGDCVRYRGLPEIINQGQYLVPRLSGENVRRAVAGPLGVVGAPVEPSLLNRLVREVGDNMDQLPLLQHALMRTYRHWQQRDTAEAISHADYETIGQMTEALGKHADEHFAALGEQEKQLAKVMFQRLTDLGAGDKGGRRPTRMAEIYGLAQALSADRSEVDRVIEQFRQLDTSFLMPPPGAPLQEENMLDISHESLIRNWARLKTWAAEEAENARLYQRLEQARLENDEDGKQGWIKGALLQRLGEWREKTALNHFWAARYHEGRPPEKDWEYDRERFERNMAFLTACAEAEQAQAMEKEIALVEQARQKQRARFRNIIIALSVVAAIGASALAFWAMGERQKARAAEKDAQEARVLSDSLSGVATKEKEVAENEKSKTDSVLQIVVKKTREVEAANKQALLNLQTAQREEARAKAALVQVEKEKSATEEQRKLAQDNYALAQKQIKISEASAEEVRQALKAQKAALDDVVRLTLAEVDRLIYQLDYDAAYAKIQSVLPYGVSEKEVSDALLEIAFWYAETGETDKAWGILDTAYLLVNRKLTAPNRDRAAARAAIHALQPARDSFLQARYFPTMRPIPAGNFAMGTESGEDYEKPVHQVKISAFQLAETETTWWQYILFCAATGRQVLSAPGWGTEGDNPVVNVSWYDAVEYANWLSERKGLQPAYTIDKTRRDTTNLSSNDLLKWIVTPIPGAKGYQLPTEAEWEYAARAGTNTRYAGSDDIDEVAWYDGNGGNRSKPVRGKTANAWGLYDMSGNVWEWCWDWYGGGYYLECQNHGTISDPRGPEEGAYRVVRSGSWLFTALSCRVASRLSGVPAYRVSRFGFRLALPAAG